MIEKSRYICDIGKNKLISHGLDITFLIMKKTIIAAFLLSLCAAPAAWGQGEAEDYVRAFNVRKTFGPQNVYYSNVRPVWGKDGNSFWYVRETPAGRLYSSVDAKGRKRSELFNHAKLAKALADASGKKTNPDSLYLERLYVNDRLDSLFFNYNGRMYAYSKKSNRLDDRGAVAPDPVYPHWMVVDEEKEWEPVVSPDGKMKAYIRDCNVWVSDIDGKNARALSNDGTPGNYYSVYIQWSPDGTKVASNRIRPAEKRYVYIVESSPADQLQPKLHKNEYAKPGDELRFKRPAVFDVATGKAAIPSTDLFEKQYDLTNLRWDADSKSVTFEFNERGHKTYRILELDAETAEVRPLVEEKADTYVQYSRNYRHDFEDGRRILWLSERDNHGHLYLYDRENPGSPRQVTKGEWYVRDVVKVDEADGVIYFSANGVNADEDPYNIHYYRINLDGTGMTPLTPAKGSHSATFSPDCKYLVDIVSSPTEAPVATLRSGENGEELMLLEKADISKLLANGWMAPEVFCAPGRDGKTPIWGIIQRPSNYDPSKTYPVIEYIYQGPHDHFVPKTFMPYNYYMQTMAELGFIVVMADGMSTAYRSRDFENVCYKNLKDAGLPDHIAWMKAVAEKYPNIDIDRVGIYGMSAGGQESANALLLHPDFYKAAYSASGCHDNRMDKIWWNELWMGYPVDESYIENSNIENAHLLRRPFMLVAGEMDDNVDPATTMQFANALIKANKNFELVIIPGARHTMGEAFGEHKRYDFFVKHIMGKEPPSWEEVEAARKK